jgi:hypothetical protein
MLIGADGFPELHSIPVELVESCVELCSPWHAGRDWIEHIVVLRAQAGEELGLGPQFVLQLLVIHGIRCLPK